jgi:hypothetical protein
LGHEKFQAERPYRDFKGNLFTQNPLERFFINPIKGDFIHAGRTFQASSLIEALKQAKKEWPLADAIRVHFSDKHDETIVFKPGWFK